MKPILTRFSSLTLALAVVTTSSVLILTDNEEVSFTFEDFTWTDNEKTKGLNVIPETNLDLVSLQMSFSFTVALPLTENSTSSQLPFYFRILPLASWSVSELFPLKDTIHETWGAILKPIQSGLEVLVSIPRQISLDKNGMLRVQS